MADALSRMKELVALLDEAARAYYQESREIMPNEQYDRLYDELLKLEAEHPELDDPASPTHRVGGAALIVSAGLGEHSIPVRVANPRHICYVDLISREKE